MASDQFLSLRYRMAAHCMYEHVVLRLYQKLSVN